MARAKPPAMPTASKPQMSRQSIERGIDRLQDRISELEAFEVNTVRNGNTPDLKGLEVAIRDTLSRCFGENTSNYTHFEGAAHLTYYPRIWGETSPDYIEPIRKHINTAVALLAQAQRTLREDLADIEHESERAHISAAPEVLSRRVFVVHGHDDGSREMVARFLEKIGFEAVILHEQANQGRTVIEKVEAHGDVGFAVVLLTPDDEGCVRGGAPGPRARQNVILELGYFIGRLGRGKVCALKRGTLEIPSDYAGVVYESMEGNWQQALGRELQEAGHEVDWNKVMR